MSTRFIIKLLIGLAILVAAFLLYRYVFVSSPVPSESPGLQAVGGPRGLPGTATEANDEFIRLLERLQSVELNSDLFATPAWDSLVSFRVELVPEPKSRRNPFASIGFDPLSTTTASSTNRGR